MRTYLYFIEPTSTLSETEAEARIGEHDRARVEVEERRRREPACDADPSGLAKELTAEGIMYLQIVPSGGRTPDERTSFEAGAAALGVPVRECTVGA